MDGSAQAISIIGSGTAQALDIIYNARAREELKRMAEAYTGGCTGKTVCGCRDSAMPESAVTRECTNVHDHNTEF